MKRQPMGERKMEWEKIFANDATNKGLISKIYRKELAPGSDKNTCLTVGDLQNSASIMLSMHRILLSVGQKKKVI